MKLKWLTDNIHLLIKFSAFCFHASIMLAFFILLVIVCAMLRLNHSTLIKLIIETILLVTAGMLFAFEAGRAHERHKAKQ